ncbi:hypothetical protein TrVE_jg9678 [Triparma verrucosa]|uniref:Uncharacterized protein n=1 Tax=Triparma verrucosa TaxID=1606542 RepID=A0A9W7BHE4_9STRA|nr:hypothetical protein TrVE_jg9678 [Triparma verrucosa]
MAPQKTPPKSKGRKRPKDLPKKGEEGYLSLTQLRNRRKRKKQKRDKEDAGAGAGAAEGGDGAAAVITSYCGSNTVAVAAASASITTTAAKKKKNKKKKHAKGSNPDQKYIRAPLKCPTVVAAQQHFSSLSLPYPITLGPLTRWRNISKLPCRSVNGGVKFGLFALGTHDVTVRSSQSPAHHVKINEGVLELERLCEECGVKPFQESSGEGELKFVIINVDRAAKKAQMTLVLNLTKDEELPTSLVELTKKLKGWESLSSLFLHYNKVWKHSNAIFNFDADSWNHLHGPQAIVETLVVDGLPYSVNLRFPPNVFRQANGAAFTKIIERVRTLMPEGGDGNVNVVELYGGVGTIGLHVLDMCKSLISSDENLNNVKAFEDAVKELPKKFRRKPSYKQLSAESMVKEGYLDGGAKVDVVIVDPPRKGCDDVVVNAINNSKAKSLIYVSCGFEAFVRDQKRLEDEGKWKLKVAEGFVLFPGADAIETLAVFERS